MEPTTSNSHPQSSPKAAALPDVAPADSASLDSASPDVAPADSASLDPASPDVAPADSASLDPASPHSAPVGLWFWCPLRMEARAVRRGAKASLVSRSGMGPKKSSIFIEQLHATLKYQSAVGRKVVIVGFGGGLRDQDKPGDVIVASEVRGPGGTFEFPGAEGLADMLSSHGLQACPGVVHSADHVVLGRQRQDLSDTGADVVEMESWWLLQAAKQAAEASKAEVASEDGRPVVLGDVSPLSDGQPMVLHEMSPLLDGQPLFPVPQAVIRVLLDTPRRSLLGAVSTIKSISHILSSAATALETIISSQTSSQTSSEVQQ